MANEMVMVKLRLVNYCIMKVNFINLHNVSLFPHVSRVRPCPDSYLVALKRCNLMPERLRGGMDSIAHTEKTILPFPITLNRI